MQHIMVTLYNNMLMKVLSYPGQSNSKRCIVGNWNYFSVTSHLRSFFSPK